MTSTEESIKRADEQLRAAFEAQTSEIACKGGFDVHEILKRRPNGNYVEELVYAAWEGWKDCHAHMKQSSKAPVGEIINLLSRIPTIIEHDFHTLTNDIYHMIHQLQAINDHKVPPKQNKDDLNTPEGQIEALWARVNFMFDRLMEEGIITPKLGEE